MAALGASAPAAVRYYRDEHIDPAVVPYLHAHGIDVLTANEAGRAGQQIADADQLSYATALGRVMVSRDQDFLNPKQVPQLVTYQHAGVVAIRRTVSVGDQARYLRYVAETETMDSMHGQIHYYQPILRGMFPDD